MSNFHGSGEIWWTESTHSDSDSFRSAFDALPHALQARICCFQAPQTEDEPYNYIISGIPGGVKYFGELEKHCFWGNEVKLYEHHVDKLYAMFLHKRPKVEYYVCAINKTFAKPGLMYFQV